MLNGAAPSPPPDLQHEAAGRRILVDEVARTEEEVVSEMRESRRQAEVSRREAEGLREELDALRGQYSALKAQLEEKTQTLTTVLTEIRSLVSSSRLPTWVLTRIEHAIDRTRIPREAWLGYFGHIPSAKRQAVVSAVLGAEAMLPGQRFSPSASGGSPALDAHGDAGVYDPVDTPRSGNASSIEGVGGGGAPLGVAGAPLLLSGSSPREYPDITPRNPSPPPASATPAPGGHYRTRSIGGFFGHFSASPPRRRSSQMQQHPRDATLKPWSSQEVPRMRPENELLPSATKAANSAPGSGAKAAEVSPSMSPPPRQQQAADSPTASFGSGPARAERPSPRVSVGSAIRPVSGSAQVPDLGRAAAIAAATLASSASGIPPGLLLGSSHDSDGLRAGGTLDQYPSASQPDLRLHHRGISDMGSYAGRRAPTEAGDNRGPPAPAQRMTLEELRQRSKQGPAAGSAAVSWHGHEGETVLGSWGGVDSNKARLCLRLTPTGRSSAELPVPESEPQQPGTRREL